MMFDSHRDLIILNYVTSLTHRHCTTILPSARTDTGGNAFHKIQHCYHQGHYRVRIY